MSGPTLGASKLPSYGIIPVIFFAAIRNPTLLQNHFLSPGKFVILGDLRGICAGYVHQSLF